MENLRIYQQWLCDNNNNIVHKTLAEWFEYFDIFPVMWKDYQMWYSNKTRRYMDIETRGGYGLLHNDFYKYAQTKFFVGNADLDSPKLRMSPEDKQ